MTLSSPKETKIVKEQKNSSRSLPRELKGNENPTTLEEVFTVE